MGQRLQLNVAWTIGAGFRVPSSAEIIAVLFGPRFGALSVNACGLLSMFRFVVLLFTGTGGGGSGGGGSGGGNGGSPLSQRRFGVFPMEVNGCAEFTPSFIGAKDFLLFRPVDELNCNYQKKLWPF